MAVVAAVALLSERGDDGGGKGLQQASTGFPARIVDEAELKGIAASAGHPVYWAGPIDGRQLEVSESKEGYVEVRYSVEGAESGVTRNQLVTIGSYPMPGAAKNLDGYAEREGAIVEYAPDGRKLVSSAEAPTSVYSVSPDGEVQVEVYAPSSKRAMSVARSGTVQPVG